MNKQLLIGTAFGAIAVTAIGAVAGYYAMESEQYADVMSVEPMMETVSTPREVCRDEVVSRKKPVKDPHQVTGTIAGAVIGGVLGSKVGGGTGKDIATVGGAVAGGYAGNKVQEKIQDGNTEEAVQETCETVYDSHEEQNGYRVTYRVDGEEHVIHMDHDPGRRIALVDGKPASG